MAPVRFLTPIAAAACLLASVASAGSLKDIDHVVLFMQGMHTAVTRAAHVP